MSSVLITIFSGLRKVFSKKKYISIAALATCVVVFLILWLPNLALLRLVISNDNMEIWEKLRFIFLSPLILTSNFTAFSAFTSVLISFLFGINIAMLAYNFNFRYGSASIGGMISGLFGVGCVSCGSVLMPILGVSGAALVLPLRGQEFNIFAIFMLFLSLYLTSKKITQKTCPNPKP